MRVFALFSLFLLAADARVSAQHLEFGAKAGPGFATLRFDPDDGLRHSRRVAADGGGFVVLPITSRLAVQIEGLFTSRGARAELPEESLTSTILLQYFDLPVLLRVSGPRIGGRPVHFFAGPYVGIRTSAKRSWSAFVNGLTTGVKEDMRDEIERIDAGVTAGAGMAIGRWVVVDGRYTHSLKKLNTDTAGGFGIWSRAVTMMAGVRF
jgi:hypothetical protein